ncbi:MAG: TolC family protein [Gemmatimonadales bacterium]
MRLARSANPMLRAEQLRALAARERVAPAGAWDDPELAVSLLNRPIGGASMPEPMSMTSVRLSQMVPWPGTRSQARSAAAALADAEALDVREAGAMLEARVTEAYHRIAAMDGALAVMGETLQLLEGLRTVALAGYSAGEAPQQDVLQAQVNQARMEADLVLMRAERQAAAARLNAMLAREPWSPVGALVVEAEFPPLPSLEALVTEAITQRPALAAAAARVRAAGHDAAQAQRERYPDLMIGVEYAQRSGFEDMASLMLGVRLPIRAAIRQRPMQREREAMRAMEEAEAGDLLAETWAQLAEAHAMASRARDLHSLYAGRILPQVATALEAAHSAYRVGAADFMTLVDTQMLLNRVRIEQIQLVAAFYSAHAEIMALLGRAGGDDR